MVDKEQGTKEEAGQGTGTEPPVAPAAEIDPEQGKIEELERQVAEEEAKAAVPPGSEAAAPAAAAPPAEAAAAPAAAAGPKKPDDALAAMRKRLREEAEARHSAEIENAYLKGQMEALALAGVAKSLPPGGKGEPPAITPEQRIAQLRESKYQLVQEYEDGKLTDPVAYHRKLDAIDDEIFKARAETLAPKPAAQSDVGRSSLTLEERTQQLIEQYPIVTRLSAEQTQELATFAEMQARLEGRPIPESEAGSLELRTRIAKLAQQFYGGEGAAAPAAGAGAPAAGSPPAPAQAGAPAALGAGAPALPRSAQALAAKLELAGQLPPDASTVGSAAMPGPSADDLLARLRAAKTDDEKIRLMESMPGLVEAELGVRDYR
jgi:hypothetical protein